MLRRGVALDDLAAECQVDPKTVARWINPGRVPHRRHRWEAAKLLEVDEVYLWPALTDRNRSKHNATSHTEVVATYPDRASVSRDTWLQLLRDARERIDVLVFSGTFFAQTNPRVAAMLAERCNAGADIRLCFGDPKSQAVNVRDEEEGLRGTLAAKVNASLTYYRELADVDGCEVRLHSMTLYASLFRYDDEMIVNPHIWGQPASANPALHLRRLDSWGWFDRYADSFDAVWTMATPWKPDREST